MPIQNPRYWKKIRIYVNLTIGKIFKNIQKLKPDRSRLSKGVSVHSCFISSQVDLIYINFLVVELRLTL
jgi:hypothetical protein